ncbi:hypothetical protein Tco_0753046 [Tanacetum coccineum]
MRSCTKSSNEMIPCTTRGKPLVLPWGRTLRLDSGVRWAEVGPLLGKDQLIIVSCGFGLSGSLPLDLRKRPLEDFRPSCFFRTVASLSGLSFDLLCFAIVLLGLGPCIICVIQARRPATRIIRYQVPLSSESLLRCALVIELRYKRQGNDVVCYTKPLDSLKSWNDHFFWVDAFACPASFPWNTSKSMSKDPFPKSSEFNAEHYATLVAYPAPFHKYPEPFLCLIGISRNGLSRWIRGVVGLCPRVRSCTKPSNEMIPYTTKVGRSGTLVGQGSAYNRVLRIWACLAVFRLTYGSVLFNSPVIVLDEDCLNSKDLSNSLIGRVKDVGSLSNLKKVDVEGIPFKFWSGKTFKKIATKWGELLDVDDHDEMSFHSKRICIHTKICSNICENFKIVFKGKVHWIRAKEATGWIPEFSEDEEDDDHSEQEFISSEQSDLGLHIDREGNGASELKDDQVQNISDNQLNGDNESVHQVEREDNRNSDGAKTNSTGSRKFKMSEIPRTGGSILSVMEEIVKVGITMGYNMDGCANDITKIIESQGGYGVNR